MSKPRVPLYERLPEIYRTKDAENDDQLQGYLSMVEEMFSEIHKNIEGLYDDLFIESCAEWVIPYIGDLLGVSHLKGDPWTIRADVAQTIKLRRRKGTIGAIELLTYNLSGWGVHCVELADRMVWNQHLNHQRPDAGGSPPYGDNTSPDYFINQSHKLIPYGGTMLVRNRALLFLAGGPFDPFAHVADVKPAEFGQLRYNLPNLAVYFTRCVDYRLKAIFPAFEEIIPVNEDNEKESNPDDIAGYMVCFYADQLKRPVRLFNNGKFKSEEHIGERSAIESMPGPLPLVFSPGGEIFADADDFCFIDTYDPDAASDNDPETPSFLDAPLKAFGVHIPQEPFLTAATSEVEDQAGDVEARGEWSFRAADLRCWNDTLIAPMEPKDIAVDPCSGRFMAMVATQDEATALEEHLRVTYTYGAPGPVGAHPLSRESLPGKWYGQEIENISVPSALYESLQAAIDAVIAGSTDSNKTTLIEIEDSEIHTLDISGEIFLRNSLIIRAADDKRPVISLVHPLKFRPESDTLLNDYEKVEFMTVRLEGLFITQEDEGDPLISQAAIHRLEIIDSTLDPGGFLDDDGDRTSHRVSMISGSDYGLSDSTEQKKFDEIPEIMIENSITGALQMEQNYMLVIENSIIDAGRAAQAIGPGSEDAHGPDLQINNGATIFGSTRVESIEAEGTIFCENLYVHNNQKGCVKFSYLSGVDERLPQHHACVKGKGDLKKDARLVFNSEIFGRHTYGQLHYGSDRRIREEGPGNDAMGAYGFLLETHKLKNINIRYREFMPAGARALLIPADNLDSCIKRSES